MTEAVTMSVGATGDITTSVWVTVGLATAAELLLLLVVVVTVLVAVVEVVLMAMVVVVEAAVVWVLMVVVAVVVWDSLFSEGGDSGLSFTTQQTPARLPHCTRMASTKC